MKQCADKNLVSSCLTWIFVVRFNDPWALVSQSYNLYGNTDLLVPVSEFQWKLDLPGCATGGTLCATPAPGWWGTAGRARVECSYYRDLELQYRPRHPAAWWLKHNELLSLRLHVWAWWDRSFNLYQGRKNNFSQMRPRPSVGVRISDKFWGVLFSRDEGHYKSERDLLAQRFDGEAGSW